MGIKNLSFEIFRREVNNIDSKISNSYINTYFEFINYFKEIDDIKRHHLIIGSHFVYGWMPTIIDLNLSELHQVLPILNEAKGGKLLKEDEIYIIKRCINNSMVGSSKLLHFINPNIYAIWDRRIFRFLTGKKSQYGIDKPKTYLEYLMEIDKITQHPNYSELHLRVENAIGASVTCMRAIDIVMFEADKKNNIVS